MARIWRRLKYIFLLMMNRRSLTYLYLVRFSLLLWLSLPGLYLLRRFVPSLTLGLFALERPFHFFYIGFYVTLAGCVALLTARITCAYGPNRFYVRPPRLYRVTADMRYRTFALAQLPGWILIAIISGITIEQAGALEILYDVGTTALGVVIALLVWLVACALDFWFHPPAALAPPLGLFLPGVRRLQPLLALLGKNPPPFSQVMNGLFNWFARIGGAGYKDPASQLLAGHALSTVLFGVFFLVYLGWLPFTAPVPLSRATTLVSLFFLALALAWTLVLIFRLSARAAVRTGWALVLPVLAILYAIAAQMLLRNVWPFKNVWHREIPALPSIGPVLMLLIVGYWVLTALAFYLDRFRVPVTPSIALLLIALHLVVHLSGSAKDHFYNLACPTEENCSDKSVTVTPKTILNKRLESSKQGPLIIVTATGGGIHAAAWTAEVLASLEHAFAQVDSCTTEERVAHDTKCKPGFHDSILLLSTVSGGSVGAVPFVKGYVMPLRPNENPIFSQMQESNWTETVPKKSKPDWLTILIGEKPEDVAKNQPPPFISAATTSSLEAVSWGIAYPDLARILIPSRSVFGLGNFEEFDRGWALERRLGVNFNTEHCPATPKGLILTSDTTKARTEAIEAKVRSGEKTPIENNDPCVTLRQLTELAKNGKVPAITFNTTTVENGGRFLLSDYQPDYNRNVPPHSTHVILPPAETFLHDYGASPFRVEGRQKDFFPDLELTTAARLSATFPYVSPVPRFPRVSLAGAGVELFADALHFADGGYYDNDGTASAIEFLHHAFDSDQEQQKPQSPRQILWIEIRDNDGYREDTNPDQCTSQIINGNCPNQGNLPAPEGLKQNPPASQIEAPPLAFWQAGHASASLRDHREMELLKRAFEKEFQIQHWALAYQTAPGDDAQPLSWHLTGRQKKELFAEIRIRARSTADIARWYRSCAQKISVAGGTNGVASCARPTITDWTVSPPSSDNGFKMDIHYHAGDSDGSGLSSAELLRAPDVNGSPGTWKVIQKIPLSGETAYVEFFDQPDDSIAAPEGYWYGTQITDAHQNKVNEPRPIKRAVQRKVPVK